MARTAIHRDEIVATAVRLFRRQGYAATGLKQLLDESGAPKGSLYHFFPGGKESVAVAAVEEAGSQVAAMIESLAESHSSPVGFVRGYVQQYAAWMEESGFRSGCPIATTLLETSPESEPITDAGRRAIDGWIALITDVFGREGWNRRRARQEAEALVPAPEGAPSLSRVTSSVDPILNVGTTVARRFQS